MEIGVQDGHSTLAVMRMFPDMELVVLCDNWGPGHGGTNRGSNDFVQQRIVNAGFPIERVQFLNGDSRELIPCYFQEHPDIYFDLLIIDDDHSVPTLNQHLDTVIGRSQFIGCHDLYMGSLMNVVTSKLEYPNVGSEYALILDGLTLSKWGIYVRRER